MKKEIILFIFISTLLLYACSDIEQPNYAYKFLPIESATTPANFTFGKIDSISIKYSLPNGCHFFKDLYYEYQDTIRVVAVTALVQLDEICTQAIIEKTYTFPIKVMQEEDYVFKFWKGEDNNGNAIFEEVIIPVN